MKTSFFGEVGLTSASANHIANIAKEAYEKIEKRLDSINFLQEDIKIIGSNVDTTVRYADSTILDEAPVLIEKVYQLKSLIAFLREAMKEKEKLFKENQKYQSEEYHHYKIYNIPTLEACIDENDIVSSWNTGEQEEYLSLETKCAVIGKFIHPNGAFSLARKNYSNRINNPVITECSGRDTIVRTFTAKFTPEEIDRLYFSLQAKHREYQAKLNGIKHKIEVAIREDNTAKSDAYDTAMEAYNAECQRLASIDRKHREERQKEIENLKIVIPNRLKAIYEEVKSL